MMMTTCNQQREKQEYEWMLQDCNTYLRYSSSHASILSSISTSIHEVHAFVGEMIMHMALLWEKNQSLPHAVTTLFSMQVNESMEKNENASREELQFLRKEHDRMIKVWKP